MSGVVGRVRRRDITELLFASAADVGLGKPAVLETQSTRMPGTLERTPAEYSAGVLPADYSYSPGTPERYGAIGDGQTDDTAALTRMIACNSAITLTAGRCYAITTIEFPRGRYFVVNFNGGKLRGIATTPSNCIVRIRTEGSTFFAYDVDMNFNTHYKCGTWWYDAEASSQYNTFVGMKHGHGIRGLVYGAFPGERSTGFAQSENSIYGFRTRGVQNPFYGNHANGALFFSEPIFVAHNEEWPDKPAFNWSEARAFENHAGLVHVDSGEIQLAATTAGYAADLSNCWLQGSVVETSEPLRVSGDFVRMSGGRILMTRDDQPQFYISPHLRGCLRFSNVCFLRPSGVGAYSNQPIVDARSAATDFEVHMSGTESLEWRWSQCAADVRLILGGVARYDGHRLKQTAADGYCLLNSNAANLLESRNLDCLGYTSDGWYLHPGSATAQLIATTEPGPPPFLPAQLSLQSKGLATASFVDASSPDSVRRTALRVRPGEVYFIEARIRVLGHQPSMTAHYYTCAGKSLPETTLADEGTIEAGWKHVQALLIIPTSAAFLGVGIRVRDGTVLWTDFRLSRCS